MKNIVLKKCLIFAVAVGVAIINAAPAHAIKKCKDADGKWHYGDVAVRACQESKVTTLDQRGFIKEEEAAPKSKEQLASEADALAAEEAEKKRILMEEQERSRILSVYETEADIDRQRDNQLYSVDSNIAVHNAYLNSMSRLIERQQAKLQEATLQGSKDRINSKIAEAKKSVVTYSSELELLKKQRVEIVEKFKVEKEVYRELTKAPE